MTPGGSLVIDASVAAKWYIPEIDSRRAHAILAGGQRLLAPDLLLAEVGNILWKKVRRGELDVVDAHEVVAALTTTGPLELISTSHLLPAALDVAISYGRSVYDALYVALAHQQSCPLVTADERLVSALAGTPYGPSMLLLSRL